MTLLQLQNVYSFDCNGVMTMNSWSSFMTATHLDGQGNTPDKMANKEAKSEEKKNSAVHPDVQCTKKMKWLQMWLGTHADSLVQLYI